MHINNTFVVPVDLDRAWAALLDVERVAPCMPGAALQSFDGEAFTGTVAVKLGALSMKYAGSGAFVERDESARRVSFDAKGRETRGSGTASATVVATLHAEGASTRVDVETDLNIAGRAAQFGRGVLNDVAERLLGQFAESLARELQGDRQPASDTSGPSVPASPPLQSAPPIDLVDLGRHVIAKRAIAPLAALAAVLIAVRLLRRFHRA